MESILLDGAFWGLIVTIAAVLATRLAGRKKKRTGGDSNKMTADVVLAQLLTLLCLLAMTTLIIARVIRTGHGPFTNMYEFSIAFIWGILVMSLFFTWKYKSSSISLFGALAGGALLLFARGLSAESAPLVPALQNSLLLSVHVFSAVIAYGAFTIGFIAAILYLIQQKGRFHALPDAGTFERLSYHTVIIGFPFMTLVIVLGAIWADIAWGSFWSWDPKETASLITWLLYAGYLHTRVVRKWQGKKSAVLLIIGFTAVAFTFFGNYFFNGLHAYA